MLVSILLLAVSLFTIIDPDASIDIITSLLFDRVNWSSFTWIETSVGLFVESYPIMFNVPDMFLVCGSMLIS